MTTYSLGSNKEMVVRETIFHDDVYQDGELDRAITALRDNITNAEAEIAKYEVLKKKHDDLKVELAIGE